MAVNESLRKAIEFYLEQKRTKLEEIRQIDVVLTRLNNDLGMSSDDAPITSDSESVVDFDELEKIDSAIMNRTAVRPDEFFGMTHAMAAKAYLEKMGHAVSMDELIEALTGGGCQVGGKDPKKTLYISLVRDVRNFVNIPGRSGFLGLRKFYPNLKAVNEKRGEKGSKLKRKKRIIRRKAYDSAAASASSSAPE